MSVPLPSWFFLLLAIGHCGRVETPVLYARATTTMSPMERLIAPRHAPCCPTRRKSPLGSGDDVRVHAEDGATPRAPGSRQRDPVPPRRSWRERADAHLDSGEPGV